jgi:hypothetical protein
MASVDGQTVAIATPRLLQSSLVEIAALFWLSLLMTSSLDEGDSLAMTLPWRMFMHLALDAEV